VGGFVIVETIQTIRAPAQLVTGARHQHTHGAMMTFHIHDDIHGDQPCELKPHTDSGL
jgi:hypothetical protein